ncbi:MAG TPA: DUF2147 domain-containing protein [Burkholderiaceae bacterium]|jgi:uncharacterized protein (DUF2147 family)|nr:DUF2147 domain-containing protein [Burkholderiaceae bacterium]
MKAAIVAGALVLAVLSGWAQSTPVGLWKTIDDDSKKEKSLVRISEAGGVFSGKIEKLLDPDTKPDAKCDKCTDERKDQPILGLPIIRNVKANGDDATLWDGGEILDPNNGKTYKVRLKPADGGKKLEVRGYIGAPLLGRTQTWHRVE